MTAHPIAAVMPEVWLCIFAFAVLLAGAFLPEKAQKGVLPILAVAGVAVSTIAAMGLWRGNLKFGPEGRAIFAADDFSLFFKVIFLFGLALSILISDRKSVV